MRTTGLSHERISIWELVLTKNKDLRILYFLEWGSSFCVIVQLPVYLAVRGVLVPEKAKRGSYG
jgi:hypothetical protein